METWERNSVIEFFQELAEKYPDFRSNILNECLAFCNSLAKNGHYQDMVVKFLAELCIHFDLPRFTLDDNAQSSFLLLDLSEPCVMNANGDNAVKCDVIVSCLMSILSSWRDCVEEGAGSKGCGQLWAVLTVLKHIK